MLYALFTLAAVVPWALLIARLSLVRQWKAVRRARRTTERIWARCPEACPGWYEHPPRRRKRGRVMAPASGGALAGVAGEVS